MSEPDPPAPRHPPVWRPLWTLLAALLLGAAALWAASKLTWFAEFRDAGVRGIVLYSEDGAQRAGVLVPLAVLTLAGVAGMVATVGWSRRVLGVVLVLAGSAACWAAVRGLPLSGHADGLPVAQMLIGRGLAMFGGILVIAGGLAGIRDAGRMPHLGARYSAPAATRMARDPDTDLWEALSDGEDPTAKR